MISLNKALPALLASTSILSACGGGSSSSTGVAPSTEASSEVSKTQFDSIMTKSGTWYSSFDLDSTITSTSSLGAETNRVSVDLEIFSATPTYIEYKSNSEIEVTECSTQATEVLTSAVFTNNMSEENLNISFCLEDTAVSQKYHILSDDHYQIEYFCGQNKIATFNLERSSGDTFYSKGSLNFDSDDHSDIENATGNSCGSLIEFKAAPTDTQNADELAQYTFDNSTITLTADYLETKISFSFAFNKALKTGEFQVVNNSDIFGDSDQVLVQVKSSAFGGDELEPSSLQAMTGTVTISEVSDNSASGTFNFSTDTSANFTGSFSFDYGN